eukprot:1793845-Rhodomonas_salina.2
MPSPRYTKRPLSTTRTSHTPVRSSYVCAHTHVVRQWWKFEGERERRGKSCRGEGGKEGAGSGERGEGEREKEKEAARRGREKSILA